MKKLRLLTVLLLTAVISVISFCLAAYAESVEEHPETTDCVHEWGEWSYVYNTETGSELTPTCTEDGVQFRRCSLCGNEEERTVPAVGHSLKFSANKVEPTCSSVGIGVNVCEVCRAEIEFELPMLKHTYGESVIGGSCTEPATETKTCTLCGEVKVIVISAAPGHLWGRWTEHREICDQEGERIRYCTVCNESEREVIPAGEHDWAGWNVVTEPTCLEEGSERRSCIDCMTIEYRAVPPTGHKYGEWNIITESTCIAEGERTHSCTVCGHTENEILAIGDHKWSEWLTIAEPTYLANGSKSRICSVCTETEVADIDKNPNPFTDVKADKWYTTPVLFCLEYEYMVGTSSDVFSLSQPVTRAMIVQIMARIANADLDAAEYQKSTFADVANGKWYTAAVTWANKHGLAGGIGQGCFGYKNSVTREELAVFLMRLTEYNGYSADIGGALDSGVYKDTERIHSWAYDAVDWALTCGVMHGSTSQHVSPRIALTRAQVAEIIYNYCDKIVEK
ncbi:MAG: S-layer homology domain-containing protein [Clostridia bacterium]|nr:S-layer homology domain-containing protein [Clostridia bacterium]